MIDKELAKSLLSFVNDDFNMQSLKAYVNYRVEQLRDTLEQMDDQGARGGIVELKKLLSIREEVIANSKDRPKG